MLFHGKLRCYFLSSICCKHNSAFPLESANFLFSVWQPRFHLLFQKITWRIQWITLQKNLNSYHLLINSHVNRPIKSCGAICTVEGIKFRSIRVWQIF
jgi:hypothetical protein